ncbi:MAG: homoserine kinase [Cyclobacteriaceae bacterium]|nr:homoserine kinase [Cyclobacteriaceae bacterium SS2]
MDQITVFSPASVANVGCGYDTFGFAIDGIGDQITIAKRSDDQLVLERSIGADLPTNPKENVATIAVEAFLNHLGSRAGFTFTIKKSFKPGSGLGSSASSAAGAVFGVNHLLGNPLDTKDLLPFVMEGEAFASKSYHADNVAPALMGGFNVIRSYDPLDIFQVPTPENLHVLIIFPDVEVKTSEAKALLPKTLAIPEARNQWANVAGVISAMYSADFELLKKSVTDFIAEPVRKKLIPGYEEVKRIMCENGSVGFNISGSGPSMFSFFKDANDLEGVKQEVKELYEALGFDLILHTSKINHQGSKIIS